jgi:hypothetical protein
MVSLNRLMMDKDVVDERTLRTEAQINNKQRQQAPNRALVTCSRFDPTVAHTTIFLFVSRASPVPDPDLGKRAKKKQDNTSFSQK